MSRARLQRHGFKTCAARHSDAPPMEGAAVSLLAAAPSTATTRVTVDVEGEWLRIRRWELTPAGWLFDGEHCVSARIADHPSIEAAEAAARRSFERSESLGWPWIVAMAPRREGSS